MGTRLELQSLLKEILVSENVYFQSPPANQMAYPAIVYKLDGDDVSHADNKTYTRTKRYLVTLMDRNPDTPTEAKLAALPMCRFNRHYAVDNLNHFVFTLFF